MIFFRLTKRIHAAEAWTGNGAKQYGGRWNHKGHAAVYVSTSIALAALEILVHAQQGALLEQYALFRIDIPDRDVEVLDKDYLPADWRQDPAPVSTMDLGSGWLDASGGAALVLPSSIIPYENNAILHASHPVFRHSIDTVEEMDFSFDARLSKSLVS